ncbi:15425_t:CDS:1, partial [Dentiscutata heterogama]
MDIIELDYIFKTVNNSIRSTIKSKNIFKPFNEVFIDNSIVESGCTFGTLDEAYATIKRYAIQTNTV